MTAPEPVTDVTPVDGEQGNREAAKYRHQLRATEGERDALKATVTTLQRTEVERIASAKLARPGALWAAGIQLEDLVDDDGHVDPERVHQAAADTIEALGLAVDLRQGAHVSTEGRAAWKPPSATTWDTALKRP